MIKTLEEDTLQELETKLMVRVPKLIQIGSGC
jgi:hypothetical protein